LRQEKHETKEKRKKKARLTKERVLQTPQSNSS